MPNENHLIDEREAKKVLERALALDEARHGSMSVEQLRDVARDMAISPSSIDQALDEHIESLGLDLEEEQPRGFRRISSVTLAAVFIVLALFVLFAIMRVLPPASP